MKKGHLLIVDDETSLLNVLSFMLSSLAEKITVCETAPDALHVIDSEIIDCILCDINLPRMSGIDILRIVRAKELKTPFILFTAETGEASMLEAAKLEAMDYFMKPQFTGIDKAVSAALNGLPYEVDPSSDFGRMIRAHKAQPL